ncbi:hypothetical protein JR338_11690 [Chloroflexota bacterium]|nr:hypothetical protein JR338_11690 [Chloroflexota bacterium]
METKINQIEVDRNKRPSYRQHKRQSFWQILLPILLSILVVLAGLAFLIVIANGGDPIGKLSTWADTSLIWLLLPMMALGLAAVLLLGAMIYGLARLLKVLPTYTAMVQHYFSLAARWVKAMVEKLLNPGMKLRGYQAGIEHFFKSIFGLLHR